MPAKKRRYEKPSIKKAAEPGKLRKGRGIRIARIEPFESSLDYYYGLAARLGGLKKEGSKASQRRITMLEQELERVRANMLDSIREITSTYATSETQQGIIAEVKKFLENPTKENYVNAWKITCGLKFED